MSRLALFPTLACLSLSLSACLPNVSNSYGQQQNPPTNQVPTRPSPSSQLTQAQLNAVGQAIWRNESGGKVSGLTAWNAGEGFASLGIGHFIWFPANYRGQGFTESFPQLLDFLSARGQRPPAWLNARMDCPWNNRAEFDAARNSARIVELRNYLKNTISLQAAFIAQRLDAALPQMLAAAPAADRARIQHNFNTLAGSPEGLFALIDYVNFKGEGINPVERYQGQGWGLLQVLQEMRQPTIAEFSRSADVVLTRRVKNSPPARGEQRWMAGWRNRVYRYGNSLNQ